MEVIMPNGTKVEVSQDLIDEALKHPAESLIAGSIYRLEMVLDKYLNELVINQKIIQGILKDICAGIDKGD